MALGHVCMEMVCPSQARICENLNSECLTSYARSYKNLTVNISHLMLDQNKAVIISHLMLHTGKCIRRFGGIYAYCRYFIDRKW